MAETDTRKNIITEIEETSAMTDDVNIYVNKESTFKQLLGSSLWDWILDKIKTVTFGIFDTANQTLGGAINELKASIESQDGDIGDVVDNITEISGTLDNLHEVATTGSYEDLEDLPTLSTIATSGNYNDLTNKPALSNVAISGSYSDLTGKPSLANVATSGNYNDLSNKPTIDNALSSSSTNAIQNQAVYDAIMDNVYYKNNDVLTGTFYTAGYLTDSRRQVHFSMSLPKCFKDGQSVTVQANSIQVRQNGQYLRGTYDSLYDAKNVTRVTISPNGLIIAMVWTSAIGGTNNDTVGVLCNYTFKVVG